MKFDFSYCLIQQLNSKMGQQSSGAAHIWKMTQSLTLVRQLPGEKIYINRSTDEEYLLLSRIIQGQDDLEKLLTKRKGLKCNYLPQLIDFGREAQGYCSDIVVVNMLFRHPAKSLAEEQHHRGSVGEWFQQGQILMISYCTLLALQEYCLMGENYELNVNQQTLLIEMDGRIILTDTYRFKDQSTRRQSLRRICAQQGKIMSRIAMMQLGVVLFRMIQEDTTNQNYSANLIFFIQMLKNGSFQGFEPALTQLEDIKRTDSTKPTNKLNSLDDTPSNTALTCQNTPIGELIHLVQIRSPLRELNNYQYQGGINNLGQFVKRKQSKHHIYKSKFQARKTQAFAEENNQSFQESTIIRLDQFSSIERQTFRETQEDEQDLNLNVLPQGLISHQSQNIPVAKIELFSSGRPQRLKQLVLNQKGIIYEESGDQLSSLASQRTHRVRNFSILND